MLSLDVFSLLFFQWRCQRSKGARSFRGQNQPRHPDAIFLVVALKTQTANAVSPSRQNTQIKRSDMVTFLFSVHTITKAKQCAGLDRAEPELEPGRWIYQPGHLT